MPDNRFILTYATASGDISVGAIYEFRNTPEKFTVYSISAVGLIKTIGLINAITETLSTDYFSDMLLSGRLRKSEVSISEMREITAIAESQGRSSSHYSENYIYWIGCKDELDRLHRISDLHGVEIGRSFNTADPVFTNNYVAAYTWEAPQPVPMGRIEPLRPRRGAEASLTTAAIARGANRPIQSMEWIDESEPAYTAPKYGKSFKPKKEKLDVTSFFKFVNNDFVLDVAALTKKQRRTAMHLLKIGKPDEVVLYLDSILNRSKVSLHKLRDMRYKDALNSDPIFNAKPARVSKMFNEMFNVAAQKPVAVFGYSKAIGIEIEFYIPKNDFVNSDDENIYETVWKLFSQELRNRRIKGIMLGTDGSIDCDEDDFIAIEARVLTSIDDMGNLEKFCALLKEWGAK